MDSENAQEERYDEGPKVQNLAAPAGLVNAAKLNKGQGSFQIAISELHVTHQTTLDLVLALSEKLQSVLDPAAQESEKAALADQAGPTLNTPIAAQLLDEVGQMKQINRALRLLNESVDV